MRIAVIPARGGSRRIPRKNTKEFCGKPIIGWPIEAAISSGLFAHILVSTEDAEIGAVAAELGAEIPFHRPASLAGDHSGTTEVIAHATRWALDQGWPLTAVCCIYATAALMQIEDLRLGADTLESGDWAYTFSAAECTTAIFRAFRELPEGGVEMFFPEHFQARSQDLPRALYDAAQFYWGKPSAWMEGKAIFSRHSCPIVLPRWRVQDIDNPDDWRRAELMFRQLKDGRT